MANSPSRDPYCVIPTGAGEGISARIHAANSQGDWAKKGRRNARRHNADSLRKRVESCVMLVASIVLPGAKMCVSILRGEGFSQRLKEVQKNS